MKFFRAFLFLFGIVLLIQVIAQDKLETPSDVRAQGIGTLIPESFLPYISKRPDLAPTLTPTNTPDPLNPTPTITETNPPSGTLTFTPTPTSTHTPTPTNTQTQTPTTTLTPTITPSPTTNPGTNYALEFDGSNDYVELDETDLMLASTWQDTKTVSLWVRPANDAVTCNFPDVAQCDAIFGDRPRWWGISQGIIGSLDRIWVWNFDNSPGSTIDIIGIEYTAGEWVHIAMVHAGGFMTVYRNGAFADSVLSGSTIQPPVGTVVLNIGGIIKDEDNIWTFAGEIDEVRIWNIARDPADIIQDLHIPLLGTETGLAAYYTMDDGAGLTLTDDSTNSWDGTLYDGGQGVPPDGSPPQWVLSTAFDTPTSWLTRIWRQYLAK